MESERAGEGHCCREEITSAHPKTVEVGARLSHLCNYQPHRETPDDEANAKVTALHLLGIKPEGTAAMT